MSTAAHANVAWHNAETLDIFKDRQSAEMGALRDMLSEQLSERNRALDRRLAQRRSKRHGLPLNDGVYNPRGGGGGGGGGGGFDENEIFSPRTFAEAKGVDYTHYGDGERRDEGGGGQRGRRCSACPSSKPENCNCSRLFLEPRRHASTPSCTPNWSFDAKRCRIP